MAGRKSLKILTYGFSLILLIAELDTQVNGMFQDITEEVFRSSPESNPIQLNYGIAVTDVDLDGQLEVVVAGYNGPNLVLKYNKDQGQLINLAVDDPSSPYYALRDEGGQAIGVCSCDVDGDGMEEIYFLNTNNAYSGMASYSDKLFKYRDGQYVDILSDDINQNIASYFAGRSVACVDRTGNGKYGIYLANYARGNVGPHSLIEMDERRSDVDAGIIALRNVAREVGVEKLTGGRGVTVGPILNKDGFSDIFCVNEHGPNFLFKNGGDGKFSDVASTTGVSDSRQHGRGVMLTDFNGDGKIDIVYGNWNGPHRIFIQQEDATGNAKFKDIATDAFAMPSPIRTVIAADFNNDGDLEILLNNIAYRGAAPNKVFTVQRGTNKDDLTVRELDIGDAVETSGRGTGGTVTDLDGDGVLEVILAHGESAEQPLTVYKLSPEQELSSNGWLRVQVLTPFGAPARGAKVTLHTTGRKHSRVIDAGSGYLCQMEPVAHFGLGQDMPTRLEVLWPDASIKTLDLNTSSLNTELVINYPGPEAQSSVRRPISSTERIIAATSRDYSRSTYRSRQYPREDISTLNYQPREQASREYPRPSIATSGYQTNITSGEYPSASTTVSAQSKTNMVSLKEDLESSIKSMKRGLRNLKKSLKYRSDVESLSEVIRSAIRMLRKALKANLSALDRSNDVIDNNNNGQ